MGDGIMINQPRRRSPSVTSSSSSTSIPEGTEIRLPGTAGRMQVHRGGPVETGRGFVCNSSDYFIENSTLPIDEHVCLTATLEILKAIAVGTARRTPCSPRLCRLGAGPARDRDPVDGWLHCPATRS